MSADTTSPSRGDVGAVGDRYRLVERIASSDTTVFWRAHDELLARPVALTVHSPGGEAAREFLAQAHRLSTLTHPAVTRVYDAVDEGHRAYVVSEWVEGTPLSAVLAEEPLDPNEAAALVGRVAEAVSQAHAAGVAFGDLHPDHIHLSRRGTVFSRLPTGQSDPTDDIRGLGALLYSTLTGQWPLPDDGHTSHTLRPATYVTGRLSTPRQVRAGVPHDLSTLAMRALEPEDPRGIRSAEAVVMVLNDRAASAPYDDAPFGVEPEPPTTAYQQTFEQPPYPMPEPRGYRRPSRYERTDPYGGEYAPAPIRTRPERRSRVVTLTALSAGVVALALIGWLIGAVLGKVPDTSGGRAQRPLDLSKAPSGSASSAPTTQSVTGAVIKPASAQLYDPDGDGQDNPEDAPKAVDGDPATEWSTVDYKRSPDFGHLKPGMGLVIDLGEVRAVHQVTVQTTTPGASLQIRAGDQPGGSVDAFAVAGQAANIGSSVTIEVPDSAGEHRYWVVWITSLVPTDGGMFHASIAEVQFRG